MSAGTGPKGASSRSASMTADIVASSAPGLPGMYPLAATATPDRYSTHASARAWVFTGVSDSQLQNCRIPAHAGSGLYPCLNEASLTCCMTSRAMFDTPSRTASRPARSPTSRIASSRERAHSLRGPSSTVSTTLS